MMISCIIGEKLEFTQKVNRFSLKSQNFFDMFIVVLYGRQKFY